MKLAAIYNVFDGVELLRGSFDTIKDHVDVVIIIWQKVSNFGEKYDPLPEICAALEDTDKKILMYEYDPSLTLDLFKGAQHEKNKRNLGLDIARQEECTHFFHIDVDEYHLNFGEAKKEYFESACSGSYLPIWTYFRKPTLRLENMDNYFVPFIHELSEYTMVGQTWYPYYCDPTRGVNPVGAVVHLKNHPMHHFSWIRKDIERKARNSSASVLNGLKGLLSDYHNTDNLKAGYVIADMGGQKLVEVENIFGIAEF